MRVCSCCGRTTNDYATFPCPGAECQDVLVRCASCRENENAWQSACGARGP